jgi:hypothetical protein
VGNHQGNPLSDRLDSLLENHPVPPDSPQESQQVSP